jgi:1,4-dihydroxy-2-naphthoate octaprenyltransferase
MPEIKDWVAALRLKTLPASISPVLIASAYAYKLGQFDWVAAIVILFCASMIQIITNFINEIYDFESGADNENRLGSTRGVSSGHISVRAMWTASIISIIITFLAGLYLVSISDYYILLVGIVSLFFSWAYTGGPYPLAYKGLGDIFVLFFFGVVAVCGTFYIYTGYVDSFIFIASFVPGILSTNILAANNIRDIDTDEQVKKITLAVRLGEKSSIALFTVFMFLVYAIEFYLFLITGNSFLLITFITLPISLIIFKKIVTAVGREYNAVLALSALFMMSNSFLFAIGILLGN